MIQMRNHWQSSITVYNHFNISLQYNTIMNKWVDVSQAWFILKYKINVRDNR